MSEETKQTEEIKRMYIKEFRELGFLQEVNRQFLHPLGLALEVVIDDETGQESLGGIWDYREDPEGIKFGEDTIISKEAFDLVLSLRGSKMIVRQDLFNTLDGVQPYKEPEKEESRIYNSEPPGF